MHMKLLHLISHPHNSTLTDRLAAEGGAADGLIPRLATPWPVVSIRRRKGGPFLEDAWSGFKGEPASRCGA